MMADDQPATFSERFPEQIGNTQEGASEYLRAGLSNPAEEYKLILGGLASLPRMTADMIGSLFGAGHKAVTQGLMPGEETEAGINAALLEVGGGKIFKFPKGAIEAFNSFHEQVTKPALQNISSGAVSVSPVVNSDVPKDVPRSQLALTGEPHIDAILNSPVTKDVIDNPIVNRNYDVPYTAGGSTPLENPTMYIDRRFPRAFTIDGITFDPADPFSVHENSEQHGMSILEAGGMDKPTAYKVAHFEIAEKAEGAWYQAHGIDQAKAEAAYKPYLDAIQKEPATNVPPNLYKDPYPHDSPFAAAHEALGEPRPTEAEIAQAKKIIADWQQKPPDEQTQPVQRPTVNPLVEARELGVIGPEKTPHPEDTPAQAAQRAIPAARTGDDKITMTPAGEKISEFERRFNYKMERIEAPTDFKQLWKESAAENNYFPEARGGLVNPAHVETLAESAGIDPTLIKKGYIKSTFDGPAIVRMADQTLRELTRRHQEASLKVESDPSPQNIAEMLKAEILRDYALEQSTGLDAEWGHTGHALRSLMQARKSVVSTGLTEGLKPPKPVKDLADAIDEFKEKTTKAVSSPGKEGALGLDKLIQAASDVVDELANPKEKKPGEKPTPLSPDVKELVKRAKAVTDLLDIKRPVDPKTGTVLPLRKILTSNAPGTQSIHAKFNKIIAEGERTLIEGIRKGKTPQAAMPPELADMIQRAENVTNYFGGAGIEKAVQDILASKGRTVEDMQNLARAVNRTDIKGAARLLSSMRGQNPNLMYWIWVQGLISGPFTHTKYALANSTYALMDRGVTTPIASMIGKLRGREDADRVLGGEAMQGIWGWIHGTPDAMKASWESIKLGQRFQLESERRLIDRLAAQGEEIPKELLKTTNAVTGTNRPIGGLAGRILGFPGDAAGAIHTFFRRAGEEAGKSAAAYRETVLEGKKISDPDFWDKVRTHKANLSTESLQGIIDDANRGTFMRELPPSMKRLQAAIKQGKYLKWVFPFMHIPIDLARAFQEHTPLAFLDPEFRGALLGKKGGREQDLAWSRIISGSLIMSYFANEYMNGRVTGSYPTDQKERAEWKLTGKIPYAIQIGDEWHSFERFGPAGSLAGLAADIGHIVTHSNVEDPENWTKMVWAGAVAAMDTMADFPGFQSIQNIIRAREDPQQGTRFAAWQAGSLLPFSSALSQTASAFDPSMRKARTFVDGLLYRLPGARETVLPNRDPLYGEPIHNPGYASVIRSAPVNKDYAKSELDRLGYYPAAPRQQIGGARLTPEQYDKYEATAGPLVKQSLDAVVRSPQWQQYNQYPEYQIKIAKEVISQARARAAAAMQMDDPSIIEAGRQRRLQQIGGR